MFNCSIQEIHLLAETSMYLLRVNAVQCTMCNFAYKFDVSNDITLGYALQVCAIEL